MTRSTRALIVSGLVAGAAAVGVAPAAACSLAVSYDAFAEADVALTGQVTHVRFLAGEPDSGDRSYEARIRVSRVYKGRTGPTVRVRGRTDGASCGFGRLRVGQRLGMLLNGERSAWAISGTSRISYAELERRTGGRSRRPSAR